MPDYTWDEAAHGRGKIPLNHTPHPPKGRHLPPPRMRRLVRGMLFLLLLILMAALGTLLFLDEIAILSTIIRAFHAALS